MSYLNCLARFGCAAVLGIAACNAPSTVDGGGGAGGTGGAPWEPVGTYHLTDPIPANLRIDPNGTFRWGLDFLAEGGGQWKAVDGRLVLTPIEDEPTFYWLVGLSAAAWDWHEFERLDIAPGDGAGELVVTGALVEPLFAGAPERRIDDITQSWVPGGRCRVWGVCGSSWEPCEAPKALECSPYESALWCPPEGEPPECEGDEDCDDGDHCTVDRCAAGDEICEHTALRCADLNDCTTEGACVPDEGCAAPVPVADGTPCAGGLCNSGACELTSTLLPCTEQGIRNAIAAGGGPYAFDCDGPTTVVTSAELLIEKDLTIDGEGDLTIDGGDEHRVLSITEDATVMLLGITLVRGSVEDEPGVTPATSGGGIANFGVLTMQDCRVSNSRAAGGGGIWNFGQLSMIRCTVSENVASEGGGILNQGYGVLDMTDSVVSGNRATRDGGGGIVNLEGTTLIARSEISANTGGRYGGGILHGGSDASMTIAQSTVSENHAQEGGGIWGYPPLTVQNSTISGNTADRGGGGISSDGPLTLVNSTVSGNRAFGACGSFDGRGGGIIHGGRGTLRVAGSTFSGNVARDGGSSIHMTLSGTVVVSTTVIEGDCGQYALAADVDWVSLDHNIESPGDTCRFNQPNDQVSVPAEALKLGALQDNGGATETHALGLGSVAIDAVPEAACLDTEGEPLSTDQRGEPRDAPCDVGAFEAQP